MLTIRLLKSLKHFKNRPTFFTTGGSKSLDLFAPFFNYFYGVYESKGWFYVFEVILNQFEIL